MSERADTSAGFAKLLKREFSAKTRARGEEYAGYGHVHLEIARDGHALAFVEGSERYEVEIYWVPGGTAEDVTATCTCPAIAQWGPCKHLWAVLLELDELPGLQPFAAQAPKSDAASGAKSGAASGAASGAKSGAPSGTRETAGTLAARAADPDPGRAAAVIGALRAAIQRNDDRAAEAGGARLESGADLEARLRAHELPRRDPLRREWRRRLEGVRQASSLAAEDPWGDARAERSRLLYVLERYATARAGLLVLELALQQRRKDGSWGAPLRIGSRERFERATLDATDRALVARLRGGYERYTGPAWADDDEIFGDEYADGWAVSDELAESVVPALCATGRFVQGSRGDEPLVLGGGEPWRVRLERRRTKDGRVALHGALVRGAERVALQSDDLLLVGGRFVLRGARVERVAAGGAIELAHDLAQRGPLFVPADEEPALVESLLRLPGVDVAELADLAGVEPAPPVPPLPRLEIEAETTGRRRRLACALGFDYGARTLAIDAPDAGVLDVDGRLLARDRAAERAALLEFLRAGGERLQSDVGAGRDASVEVARLPGLVRALVRRGWRVEAEGRRWRVAGAASVSVRSGLDWFDLEGGVDFGGEVVDLPALLAAAREGRDTVRLGDGSEGVLPERWLEQWRLLELGAAEDGRVRFERRQGWLLDALLAERADVAADEGFERLRASLADLRRIAPRREPAAFRGTLREYQREALGWLDFLAATGLGGCLADDMGLGKTVQVLALLADRRARGAANPSLVVAPRSVVFNWIDEARRFAPDLRVVDYTGTDRRARLAEPTDLLVTTYGTLRRDAPELAERAFDWVVLDEAQAIKNARSQAAKAARLLRADHRLALSGTPIENSIGELWSLFEFLNPGMLGRSSVFADLVARRDADEETRTRIVRAIRPFLLRRTKEEVLADLPPKTEQVLWCTLAGRERREYDELRAHYRAALLARADEAGIDRMKIVVLEALLRLRQAACHPGLVDKARRAEASAKLDVLLPMLEELVAEGHKALVFSQFTSLLAIVRARLDERGLAYEVLDGRTRNRKERVERFMSDPACPLFLVSLKAGGSGLNLTAADYVFLLDPWWNPAVEAQAVDRAHRIGRTRPVVAYRLIARDTVEQKVLELQAQKRELAEAILGGGRGVLRDLTRADLEALFS